ncbi:ABC transporter permease [Pseudonocardia spinosispora]|uniref:ABC transporter permease n=1 Tax=Pseudonocardia spinosispora TaxID=103441 RepID=UPI000400542A|nr:ABC transporter permease [Pseudonocardia spinosispora]
MTIRETLLAALRSLRSNRLRALLTTLGIIIGVAAVIILVALGNGVKAGFDEQLSKVANQITISKANGAVPGGGTARDLTDADVAALQNPQDAPAIASVTPMTTGSAVLTAGQAQEQASLTGSTADYLQVADRAVQVGRFFTTAEEKSNAKVLVIGQEAIGYLWGPSANLNDVVGQNIRVGRSTFKVIGVLVADGQEDNTVIMPLGTSRAYLIGGGDIVNQIIVKATSANSVKQATAQINTIMDKQHRMHQASDRDYKVRSQSNRLAQRTEMITFLTIFTAAVAAISLIVGGIGVANIMLVAVTERTREIGIRKAIGAPRRAILKQFLTESVMLCGLGGLIGVIIGVGTAVGGGMIVPKFVPSFPPPVLTAFPVLIAFAVSLVIGVVAGGYPANRAARLRPIEALRFE